MLTPSITMLLEFSLFQLFQFLLHPSRRSPLCHSRFVLLRICSLLVTLSSHNVDVFPAEHVVPILSHFESFHTADSVVNAKTTTLRSSA